MSNRFTNIALAALIASTSTAALATSADVSINGDAGVSADVGGASGSADVNAAAGAETSTDTDANASGSSTTSMSASAMAKGEMPVVTYGDLVSDLKKSAKAGFDTSMIEASAEGDLKIETVTLSDIPGKAAMKARALENEIEAQKSELDEMRAVLSANADIAAELEAKSYSIDDVVMFKTAADNTIVLIIDDRG